MTPADSLLEQLERAERSTTGPPPEVSERMWASIEQRLVQGPPPPELDPLDPHVIEVVEPVPGPSAAVGRHVLLKIVGGVGVVGLAAGLLALSLDRDDEPAPEPEPVVVVEPESREPTIQPITPEPTIVPEPTIAPEPTIIEPQPEPAAKPSKPSGTKPVAPKGLAEELALMQSISTALADGDSAKVLELVADHRRDFPHGQFIEERSAAEARALCRRGKPKGKTKA
jgi:hypothetical protein